MTHDLESLRRAITEQLPMFVRGKLAKFEQAIREDERRVVLAERAKRKKNRGVKVKGAVK